VTNDLQSPTPRVAVRAHGTERPPRGRPRSEHQRVVRGLPRARSSERACIARVALGFGHVSLLRRMSRRVCFQVCSWPEDFREKLATKHDGRSGDERPVRASSSATATWSPPSRRVLDGVNSGYERRSCERVI